MAADRIKKKFIGEEGQSMVEFALILPIILLLLLVPVDIYRFAHTKMLLNSANSDIISQVTYVEGMSSDTVKTTIQEHLNRSYADILDVTNVQFDKVELGTLREVDYNYLMYTSEKEDEPVFQDKFQLRTDAKYQVRELEVQLSYTTEPATFWGAMFFGDTMHIESSPYKRTIYCGGN